MNCSDSQVPRNKSVFQPSWQLSRPSYKCRVTQKLGNSSVVYNKTNNPFGAKICMNISFQLLLYIIKVKSQEYFVVRILVTSCENQLFMPWPKIRNPIYDP